MTKGRVHLIIHGYVQGVFYRASTRDAAVRFGLTGWVRNLPDGNVEAVFEGPVEKIHDVIEWCSEGPPGARVIKIDENWQEYTGEYLNFDIRRNW